MTASYITLMGAEQVQSAANRMQAAADTMRSAVASMDHVLTTHMRRMDEWLERYEALSMHERILAAIQASGNRAVEVNIVDNICSICISGDPICPT